MVIKFPLTDYKLFHSLYQVCQQAIPQFWLKPGAFWRHNFSTVGNCKKLFKCNRVQTEGGCHFTTIHSFFQFFKTTYTTHKIYPVISSWVFYIQNFIKNIILQNGYI